MRFDADMSGAIDKWELALLLIELGLLSEKAGPEQEAATRGWLLDSWRRARRTPDSSESASLRRGCSRRGSTLPSTAPALTRSGPSSSANIKCLRTRAGAFSGSGA